MTRQTLRELARQAVEGCPIGAVCPQDVAPRLATPCRDVAAADGRPRTHALAIHEKQVVGSRFHPELRRPAIGNGGEGGPQTPADTIRAREKNPRTVALQLPLLDHRSGRL